MTLRRYLAARHAQSTPANADPLSDDALADAARAVTGLTLEPAKLALLRATLSPDALRDAARHLTPTQAQEALRPRARKPAPAAADGALTVASLEALPPDAWAEFARWLLEQAGARIEPQPFSRHVGLVAWRGEQDGQPIILCAWRLESAPLGWPLLEDDLRRMAALAAGEPGARLVVVSTAEATVGARQVASTLGQARLIDRPALTETLARLSSAYQREQESAQDAARACAKAAGAARKKLLAALTTLSEQAQAAPNARKATGRAAVRTAATAVEQARRLAAQALMAWETLMADWSAAFDERPARDSSLSFSAEPPAYAELAERADHLKKPLLDALRALGKAPGEGDLGYAAWRLAVGEELAARCSALHWKAQVVDPAQWQDFSAAVADHALQEASRAENAATHAAARAAAARSALVERIGAL
jgi:hypothetical protein